MWKKCLKRQPNRGCPAPTGSLVANLVRFLGLFASLSSTLAAAVNYDIVYVRQPRYGDNTNTTWPEVFHPARLDPGADLVLLHPNGSEEVLVAGDNGGVTDPFISFDGQWCYYVLFPDQRKRNGPFTFDGRLQIVYCLASCNSLPHGRAVESAATH